MTDMTHNTSLMSPSGAPAPCWARVRSVDQHPLALLLAVVGLGLVLRVAFLSHKSLWLDEIFSVGLSRIPWRPFWQILGTKEPNMAFYYVMLRLWTHIGTGEWMIRALSVVLGVVAIPVLYALGNRLFGKPVGLISGLLLATNAFHVQWSQEARGYSLVVLLVTCSSLFFVRSIEHPSSRNWIGYVITSVLAIYTHIFAVLVLASHMFSLLFHPRRLVAWKSLVASFAAIVVLASPTVFALYLRVREPLPQWIPKSSFHDIYDAFYSLAGNAAFAGSKGGQCILLSYFLLCAIAVWSTIKTWRCPESSYWREAFVLSWLLVPIILVFAMSVIQPLYVNRYLLICVPPLALMAAKGVASVQPRWVAAVCVAAVLTLAVFRLPAYYAYRVKSQDWKGATDYIVAKARPNDAVIFWIAPGRLLFDYYWEHYHNNVIRSLDVVYPQPDPKDYGDRLFLTHHPPMDQDILDSITINHNRIWVVFYFDQLQFSSETTLLVQRRLSVTHANVEHVQVGHITLLLYENEAVTTAPAADSYCRGLVPCPNMQ